MRYPNTIKEVESLGDFRVWVTHERNVEFQIREDHIASDITRVLICRPFGNEKQPPKDHVLAIGEAYCSEQDDFTKKIGVRIALGRACKTLGLKKP